MTTPEEMRSFAIALDRLWREGGLDVLHGAADVLRDGAKQLETGHVSSAAAGAGDAHFSLDYGANRRLRYSQSR